MRILIIDDEESIRTLLSIRLESQGYEVFSAPDGVEGLRSFESVHPDIVILDVTMPGLDGYGVLKRLRQMGNASQVYVLMLTAKSELEELERGLGSGANDFLTKPFEIRELIARIRAAERIQSLQEKLLVSNRKLGEMNQALQESLRKQELLNRKMLQEMEMAAVLQNSILSPDHLSFGRVDIRARYRPSAKLGGDYYDLRPIERDRGFLFIADAVGHGVSAALLAAMLKIALEDALDGDPQPADVLAALNRTFQFCSGHGKYLTAVAGLLDCKSGHLTYAMAGHVPPLLYRCSTRSVLRMDAPGYCLGIFEDGLYENREVQIERGDRLLLYTDGVSDASPDDQTLFGSRLPQLLTEWAALPNDDFLDRLESELSGFSGAEGAADDYTLLSTTRAVDPAA